MTKVLVISDTHISPECSEEDLWRALGEYCVVTKPDCIVHLGDVADLDSQARYVKDRKRFVLDAELDAVRKHLIAFHTPIEAYNDTQRRTKHRQYRPALFLTQGNHDVRNDSTGIAELFEDFGWFVLDYLEPLQIDDITFVHAMHKGLSDTMCTTAQELVENWHSSIIVGHGHHKDFFESYSMALHKTITGLRSPVFTLRRHNWCPQTGNKWSRGFTEITTDPFTFVWKDCECLLKSL